MHFNMQKNECKSKYEIYETEPKNTKASIYHVELSLKLCGYFCFS